MMSVRAVALKRPQSPWNFDTGAQGFRSGLGAVTDEASIGDPISNWGEDKNFNGIEDGVCDGDGSIACFQFGGGLSDARCAHLTNQGCSSVEVNGPTGAFVQNVNQAGGCGVADVGPESLLGSRHPGLLLGCRLQRHLPADEQPDQLDVRVVFGGGCASVLQCADIGAVAPPFKLLECGKCSVSGLSCGNASECDAAETCDVDDSTCAGGGACAGCCQSALQTCEGDVGLCNQASTSGGVWHTGRIRDNDGGFECDGGPSDTCQDFEVISGQGQSLQWWEFLATPVMSKVNQERTTAARPAIRCTSSRSPTGAGTTR